MTSSNGQTRTAAAGGDPRAAHVAPVEALLRRQQDLFTKLDVLSAQQAALIQQEQTDQLLDVLARRQIIVDEIGRLSAEIEPWRARWTQFIAALPDADRQRVREQVDAIAILAQRIAARDESDRKLMEQRKGALAVELGHVSRGRGAVAAYGSSGQGNGSAAPRFQDREA
jgi:hypothetical protein